MKLFLIILCANLLSSFLSGFVRAAWTSFSKEVFPKIKWQDGRIMWRISRSEASASYMQLLNLQTPARRREVRRAHEEWVESMNRDYGMNFSPTL